MNRLSHVVTIVQVYLGGQNSTKYVIFIVKDAQDDYYFITTKATTQSRRDRVSTYSHN